MNYNIQLVIPMAGNSGRAFEEAGYTVPRWLIDIDGKPMVQHVLDQFPGVTDILFICNEEEAEHFHVLESLGGKVVVAEPNTNGPVDTILRASDHISDEKEVIVSYCDHGMSWDFQSFLDEVSADGYDGAMTCYTGFHPHLLGTTGLYTFCEDDERTLVLGPKVIYSENRLVRVHDKQPVTKDTDEFISSDVFYFRNGITLKEYFEMAIGGAVNPYNGNHFVAPVYNLMVADGLNVCIHEIDKMMLWATPQDLEVYKQWSRYFCQEQQVDKAPEQDFTLVLPMSGKGTRFAKEGYDLPKPLLPVDGKPMAVRVAECLPRHRNNVFVCLKEHSADELLRDHFPDATVRSIDHVTEGYAASCELGIELIDEDSPIMISPCDNGVLYDEQAFLDMVADEDNDVIIWSVRNSQACKVNPDMYTWMYVDENDFLHDMIYKQVPPGDPLKTHVSVGVMYFRKAKYLLEGLAKNREQGRRPTGELCMDSVAHQLADIGYNVKVFEIDHYACWGTPDDYRTYNYWKEHFDNVARR